jgi:hypothetical protein
MSDTPDTLVAFVQLFGGRDRRRTLVEVDCDDRASVTRLASATRRGELRSVVPELREFGT